MKHLPGSIHLHPSSIHKTSAHSDPRTTLSSTSPTHTLVVVFLRGGADGLHLVVPYGETAYHALRPTLRIPAPDDNRAPIEHRALDLDGFFGFHPSLKPLLPIWQAGHLACVQAVGAPDESRSHFKAMELIERGVSEESGPVTGWLGRVLEQEVGGNSSPLRAVSMGEQIPRSLYGPIPAATVQSLADFQMGETESSQTFTKALSLLYQGDDPLRMTGIETLKIVNTLETLDTVSDRSSDTTYPETPFGQSLQQLALLLKAQVGVEIAALDLKGWDTHFAQGVQDGLMPGLMTELATGLEAFYTDLQDHWDQLTVTVMSEFGRRAHENASLGTDHGRGGLMMVLGSSIAGGQIYGEWPGLKNEDLVGPGDLAVTTDFRDILAEILMRRMGVHQLEKIFPDYQPNFIGISGE